MTHCKSCGAPYSKQPGSFCDYCGTVKPQSLNQLFDANEAAVRQLQASFELMERQRRANYGMSSLPRYGMSALAFGYEVPRAIGGKRGWW